MGYHFKVEYKEGKVIKQRMHYLEGLLWKVPCYSVSVLKFDDRKISLRKLARIQSQYIKERLLQGINDPPHYSYP